MYNQEICIKCCVCSQGDVLRYELVQDDESGDLQQLFWLNSQSGVIIARQPLSQARRARYEVRRADVHSRTCCSRSPAHTRRSMSSLYACMLTAAECGDVVSADGEGEGRRLAGGQLHRRRAHHHLQVRAAKPHCYTHQPPTSYDQGLKSGFFVCA